jgi:hypothetical protein
MLFFRRVLELDAKRTLRFEVLGGDLLLHNIVYRTTAAHVVAEDGQVREQSTLRTADMDLFKLVMWDFVDSLGYGWTTVDLGDKAEATMLFARHSVNVLAVVGLPREIVVECDRAFAAKAWYIGAAEMDLGNPMHVRALQLPHALTYRRGDLGLVGEVYDDDSETEVKWSQGEWPHELGFDSVKVVSRWTDDPAWTAPGIRASPLSERGAITVGRTQARSAPRHFERVAEALRSHVRQMKGQSPASVSVAEVLSDPIVDRRKLLEYVLTEDPTRREGFAKAVLFRDLLGITAADWRYLAAQLEVGLADATPLEARSTPHGVQYAALVAVRGRNGDVVPVVSAWIIEENKPPRMTTAYVARRGTPIPSGGAADVPVLRETDAANWQALYEMAVGAGDNAAAATVPTPMFLAGSDPIEEGTCGGASVVIPDARRRFPHWLIKKGYARRGYRGGAQIHAQVSSQSVERATSWANAFAKVLRMNDIACTVETYLD